MVAGGKARRETAPRGPCGDERDAATGPGGARAEVVSGPWAKGWVFSTDSGRTKAVSLLLFFFFVPIDC